MGQQQQPAAVFLGLPVCVAVVWCALLPAGSVLAQQANADRQRTVETRLQRLEDGEAIRDLLSRYMHYLDGRAYLRYSQLFARDGELVVNGTAHKGPDAILKFLGRGQPTPDAPPVPGASAHMHSDLIIELSGDTATTTARWTMVSLGPDKAPRISGRGHYEDVLTREDGKWKFKSRKIVTDLLPPAPATN